MFTYIKGTLEVKTTGYVVVEANGIGYKIFMSEPSIEKLGEIGENVKVYTYLRIRSQEDEISLFGFNSDEELRMFELLITVSGVGAKSALAILANISPSSFALAVITDDILKLKALPGIGAKTAQRLILELKDKLKNAVIKGNENVELKENVVDDEKVSEAVSALQVLGYSRKEIATALKKVDKQNLSVEDIIRKGLSMLNRN